MLTLRNELAIWTRFRIVFSSLRQLNGHIIGWSLHGLVATELHLYSSASGQKKLLIRENNYMQSGIYYASHALVFKKIYSIASKCCFMYILQSSNELSCRR